MTTQALIITVFAIVALVVAAVWVYLLLKGQLNTEANVMMTAVVGGLITISTRSSVQKSNGGT